MKFTTYCQIICLLYLYKIIYSALVWISKIVTPEIIDKINQYQDKELTIKQQTPIRVLQRYSLVYILIKKTSICYNFFV